MIDAPPYTVTMLSPRMCLPNLFKSLAICTPNSRVGAIINACVDRLSKSILFKIGRPNAAVLPVPVCARPTKSVLLFNT